MRRPSRDDSGFTIVEYVTAATILLFVSVAVMSALAYAASAASDNSMREEALSLANERMEQAHNLPYDSVGTTSGYVLGVIQPVEAIGAFSVTTDIDYARDAATGRATCKKVRITVSWASPRAGNVSIESNIAGKSSVASNVGDVEISVVDADTNAVIRNAAVTVTPILAPATTRSTDASGVVFWGRVPAGKIVITGSCPGYGLDVTTLTDAAVISGITYKAAIKATKVSTAKIAVLDVSKTAPNNLLPGIDVTITGPSGPMIVTSDSSGVARFNGLLKGLYTVTSGSGYNAVSPTSFSITVGATDYAGSVTVRKKTTLTVTVTDKNGAPVSGAAMTIVPAAAGTGVTDASGKCVYDIATTGSSYTVQASKSGFVTKSGTSPVIGIGDNAALGIQLSPAPGQLSVTFTFGSSEVGTFTVYVFGGTSSPIAPAVASSTVNRKTGGPLTVLRTMSLAPGQYWVGCKPAPGAQVKASAVSSGATVTVGITSTNY